MKKKHHKEDIIAAGIDLIRQNGFHSTGINDLLKACDIPKGSFYNFFPTKEDYAIAALHLYAERTLAFYNEALEDDFLKPYERLKFLYLHSIVDQQKAEDFAYGCLLHNLSVELGGSSISFAEAIDEAFNSWIEVISGVVKAGQDAGKIRKDQSADKIARYLHGSLFGAFSQMKVTRSAAPIQNIMTFSLEAIKA